MPSLRRRDVALAQAVYYGVTGAWPLVSRRSFEAVTGRKTDWWLVQTFSLTLLPIGAALLFLQGVAEVFRCVRCIRDGQWPRRLNDVEELENPTSENVARWVWKRLVASLPQLSAIEIRETCTSGVIYRGEDEPS